MLRILAFIAACLVPIGGAQADPFELGLPIACTPDLDCWIANYFDRIPHNGLKDVGCGARTYEGHDGVDFALRDLKAMRAGVAVLAAAPGRIKAVRDGVPDISVKVGGREAVAGKECGNGVVIEHGGGWETQYCHMRKDSIAVKPGQDVQTGDKLGVVGLSGFTEFPHAHITARKDGVAVDPFDGHPADGTCGVAGPSLWKADLHLAYESVALIAAGVSGGVPAKEAAERGDLNGVTLSPSAPVLALWVRALGVEPGDKITLRLRAPEGQVVFESIQTAEKRQAAWFAFAARKRPPHYQWSKGTYRGEVTLVRGGPKPETLTVQSEAELR